MVIEAKELVWNGFGWVEASRTTWRASTNQASCFESFVKYDELSVPVMKLGPL